MLVNSGTSLTWEEMIAKYDGMGSKSQCFCNLHLDKAASATDYSVRVIAVVTAISILTSEQYPGQCGVKKRGEISPLPVLLHVLNFFSPFSFLESQFRGHISLILH